jgi:hypothetical protein
MATFRNNEIRGYVRHTDQALSMFTTSPTGGVTDTIQYLFTTDSKEQADLLEAFLNSVWQKVAESLQGYPCR